MDENPYKSPGKLGATTTPSHRNRRRVDRPLIRCVSVAALYTVAVVLLATLKATTTFLDAMTWAELVYGPAITVGCCCVFVYVAVVLECWLRLVSRSGDSPSHPGTAHVDAPSTDLLKN
jgi:hypothetical protein